MVKVRGSDSGRPVMILLDLLGRRWALRILWELWREAPLSFRALQDRCGGLSPTVLNTRLAELRAAGIVAQEVGYRLTPAGGELAQALLPVHAWADRHLSDHPWRVGAED